MIAKISEIVRINDLHNSPEVIFGHPHKEVLDLLQSKGVKILRNDTNGIIEVDFNGNSFYFKTEKD